MDDDDVDDGPDPTLVLVSAAESGDGNIEIEFDDGRKIEGACKFLSLTVLDTESTAKFDLTLIIPQSVGPQLISQLLTEDQWEAAINA